MLSLLFRRESRDRETPARRVTRGRDENKFVFLRERARV